jgi:hypothetical protein
MSDLYIIDPIRRKSGINREILLKKVVLVF